MFRVYHTRIMTGALILSNLQTIHGMKRPGPYTRKTMMGSLGNAPIQSHWPGRARRHLDENTNHRSMRRRLPLRRKKKEKEPKWEECYKEPVSMKETKAREKTDNGAFNPHKIDFRSTQHGVEFSIPGFRRSKVFKIKKIRFGRYIQKTSKRSSAEYYLVFTLAVENSNPRDGPVKDRHIILAELDNEDQLKEDWHKYLPAWFCLMKILKLLKHVNHSAAHSKTWGFKHMKHSAAHSKTWEIPRLDGDNFYNGLTTGEKYFEEVIKTIRGAESLFGKINVALVANIEKLRMGHQIDNVRQTIAFLKKSAVYLKRRTSDPFRRDLEKLQLEILASIVIGSSKEKLSLSSGIIFVKERAYDKQGNCLSCKKPGRSSL